MGGTSVHVNLCRFFMFFYHCFCVPRCTRTKFVLSVVVPYPVDYVKSQLLQHTGTQAVCCTVRQPMPKITKTVNFWRFINRFSRIHHCTSMIFVSSVAIQISWFWAMPFWAAEKNFFCHANLNRSGQFQRYATESFIMICQTGSAKNRQPTITPRLCPYGCDFQLSFTGALQMAIFNTSAPLLCLGTG